MPSNSADFPLFSVVTVSYNSATTIADALLSVAVQSEVSVEHIVVDGGSTDGTLDIVNRLGRVTTLISEPDRGIYDAMNKGLRVAKGRYVGFLNSDDYFASAISLARLGEEFGRSGSDAVWGNVMQIDENARPVRFINGARANLAGFARGMMPPHPAFYAKAELMRAVGGFKLDFRIAGDFDLLLRLFMSPHFSGHHIDQLVTVMRTGGISTSGLAATKRISAEMLEVLRSYGVPTSQGRLASRYPRRLLELLSGRLARLRGERFEPPEAGR